MAEAHIYLERTISHCVSALLDLIDLRLWTGGARKGFLQKSIAYNDYYLIGLFYFVFVHIRLNLWLRYLTQSSPSLKGILHQKKFYRLNLIFWIVMGCGIARFGRRGLKTTET